MTGGELPETVERWKELASQEPDAALRANYKGLALVFADKRDRRAIWKAGLEGWNMEIPSIVREWQEEGFKKGEEKGLELGLEKGQAAIRALLLRLLSGRLGEPPSADLLKIVEAEKDLDRLSRWVEQVAQASSPEQARSAVLPPYG